jgi:hypothetical protein
MARELNLAAVNSIAVITREEVMVDTDKISIDILTDNGQSVTARISFFNSNGYSKTLVLWEGQDYSNIGEWTDLDVDLRIKELLNVA